MDEYQKFVHRYDKNMELWNVMFEFGTVIRVDIGSAQFQGYGNSNFTVGVGTVSPEDHKPGQLRYVFPTHRVRGNDRAASANRIKERNVRIWDAQKTMPGDPGTALRVAYHSLIDDGYMRYSNYGEQRRG